MKYTKMDALGNDYIYVLIEENPSIDIKELIAITSKISNRKTGISSDGLIIIGKDNDQIWCRIFNADASEAETCGNGLRCVARLCYDKGIVKNNEFKITLKKTGHTVNAVVNNDAVSIDMGKATVGKKERLDYKGNKIEYINVSMTNPHAVVECEDLNELDIKNIGPFIEKHKNFPNRTNVEFYNLIDKKNIRFRVWERGSGETKACGSGACAVFAAVYEQKKCDNVVDIHMLGGTVKVELKSGTIYLTGPANYVTTGEYPL